MAIVFLLILQGLMKKEPSKRASTKMLEREKLAWIHQRILVPWKM